MYAVRAHVVKAYRQRALHGCTVLRVCVFAVLRGIELAACVLAKRCVYWVAGSARAF